MQQPISQPKEGQARPSAPEQGHHVLEQAQSRFSQFHAGVRPIIIVDLPEPVHRQFKPLFL